MAPSTATLTVYEDLTYQRLKALSWTLALIACFIVTFAGVNLGLMGMIWAYLMALAAMTAAYFMVGQVSRAWGKSLKQSKALEFEEDALVYYPSANPNKALRFAYSDIASYQLVREAKAIRVLLRGSWVKHPSGVEYLGIVYGPLATELPELEQKLAVAFAAHKVKRFKAHK